MTDMLVRDMLVVILPNRGVQDTSVYVSCRRVGPYCTIKYHSAFIGCFVFK